MTDKNESAEEQQRLQVSRTRTRHIELKKIGCHNLSQTFSPCGSCCECRTGHVTTFHLNYFEYYGLNTENAIQLVHPRSADIRDSSTYSLPITWELVAQAFEIVERQRQEIESIPRLFALCTVNIVQHCYNIDALPLPESLKRTLREFTCGFDIVESQMSKTPGNTMFRPWNFPRYLFNHLDKYLCY